MTTTIVTSHGDGGDQSSRTEERFPVQNLRSNDEETASAKVTQAVSTKISDALYYGDGKWDKIPYTVEVFSSVTVTCDQTEDKLLVAQNVAHQMAFESSQERIKTALLGHVANMRNHLYRSMFDED